MTQQAGGLTPGEVYDANRGGYERLLAEITFGLTSAMKAQNIKTHSISGRVKERTSFLEKIERKSAEDPFTDIQDRVGARVVCLFLSDLPHLRDVIRKTFKVLHEEDKVESGDATSFGYMSVHYICKLREEHLGPRYEGLKSFVFEVQCRTIVMDAWANISHYLAYKGNASVPEHLRRDFHALSGLFYVADQHFELFFAESLGSRSRAAELVASESDKGQIPIDADTVTAYFRKKYQNRSQSTVVAVSNFVEELSLLDGYDTIEELDRALSSGHKPALRYERKYPPRFENKAKYADVGIARAALAMADVNYAKILPDFMAARYDEFR